MKTEIRSELSYELGLVRGYKNGQADFKKRLMSKEIEYALAGKFNPRIFPFTVGEFIKMAIKEAEKE